MKYAICNETFHDRSIQAGFALARDCGYTGIEIAPFTLGTYAADISSQLRQLTRNQAADAGLEVVGLHWLLAKTQGFHLTTSDATTRERTGLYLAELARLCRDLGGSLMVLGSPQQRNLPAGVSHDEGVKLAADCLARAVPTLQDCQVTIAVEPLGPSEGNFLNTAASAAELIALVDSPWVQLQLDVKAMSSEQASIPQLIRAHRQQLRHFHANDPNRQGPGFGSVDFKPILAELAAIEYSGWVSVEVFDYTPGVERLARESLSYLQACEAEYRGVRR